jgi:hypothetical protein
VITVNEPCQRCSKPIPIEYKFDTYLEYLEYRSRCKESFLCDDCWKPIRKSVEKFKESGIKIGEVLKQINTSFIKDVE